MSSIDHHYGLISDGGGPYFVRGQSEDVPGNNASGPAGRPSGNFSWDTDASYADWYGGHEIGHMYGRQHPEIVPYIPGTKRIVISQDGRELGFWRRASKNQIIR